MTRLGHEQHRIPPAGSPTTATGTAETAPGERPTATGTGDDDSPSAPATGDHPRVVHADGADIGAIGDNSKQVNYYAAGAGGHTTIVHPPPAEPRPTAAAHTPTTRLRWAWSAVAGVVTVATGSIIAVVVLSSHPATNLQIATSASPVTTLAASAGPTTTTPTSVSTAPPPPPPAPPAAGGPAAPPAGDGHDNPTPEPVSGPTTQPQPGTPTSTATQTPNPQPGPNPGPGCNSPNSSYPHTGYAIGSNAPWVCGAIYWYGRSAGMSATIQSQEPCSGNPPGASVVYTGYDSGGTVQAHYQTDYSCGTTSISHKNQLPFDQKGGLVKVVVDLNVNGHLVGRRTCLYSANACTNG